MYLEEFLNDITENVTAFEKYWRAMNEEDPVAFPMEMEEGNEGLWWEQFNETDVSAYTVETVDGWIPLTEDRPDVKEMVAFKAIDVPVGTFSKYTTDPWCGWINEDGSFSRWPHKDFTPTHFKRI